MRRGVILIVILLLLSRMPLAESASQRIVASPVFSFEYLRPGQSDVPLGFIIENESEERLENVFARIVLPHPFSPSVLARPELRSDAYDCGDMEARSTRQASFKIDVSASAGKGDFPFTLVVNYDDPRDNSYRIEESSDFTLHVAGDTLVELTRVDITPRAPVAPGSHFGLNVHLRNEGDNNIRWLKISLALPPEIVSVSPDQRIFEEIRQGGSVVGSFELTTEMNSSTRNYSIQLILEYKDETQTLFRETRVVGIEVKGEARIAVASVSTNPSEVKAGDPVTLTIRIENSGVVEAKSTKARIDLPFSGVKEAFLGEIKKDEDAPAVFILRSGSPGEYTYSLTIEYEDDAGTHSATQPLSLVVYPKIENGTFVLGGAGLALLVAGAIAASFGYLYWRKRRR